MPRPDNPDRCRNGRPLWVNGAYVRTCCAEHWWQPLPASAATIPAGGAQ